MGATGTRLVLTLLKELRRRGLRRGLATLCVGGGQGAAVVVETGSLLSHASIVARELGLPSVVAVPGATRLLRDGQQVEVDGTHGRVRPL